MKQRIRFFTTSRSSFAALAAIVVVPVIACGGGDKTPPANPQQQQGMNQQGFPQQQQQFPQQQGQFPQQQQQPQQGQFPQQQQPQQGQQPAAAGSGALPGSPVPQDLLAQIMGAGAAIMQNPSGGAGGLTGDPTELGIKLAAARFAPGMQPEGQMAKDNLQQDGHKEMMISMQGGKCYTIIGFSPLGGIKNLDLHLLAPPFYNVQAGQDDSTDNTAVSGRGNNPTCPITPFPLQYKVDLHARNGAGPVGVQVFSKSK
jgi:hypothetical protein